VCVCVCVACVCVCSVCVLVCGWEGVYVGVGVLVRFNLAFNTFIHVVIF
jgi:hypothetical protein